MVETIQIICIELNKIQTVQFQGLYETVHQLTVLGFANIFNPTPQ